MENRVYLYDLYQTVTETDKKYVAQNQGRFSALTGMMEEDGKR